MWAFDEEGLMSARCRARRFVVAAGLVAIGVAGVANDARAQGAQPKTEAAPVAVGLTNDQCIMFRNHLTDHIRVVGRQHLSNDFVNAMIEFAVNRRCSAPANIPAVGRDIDVFNSISNIMRQTQNVNLRGIGITLVAPK